ncbi:hypothetical protein [Candidatus Accumulibacter sp. ACC003]|uniref:hypothetical protein n=1 Tax=Candidatus Accumulibacter sp. ACC003 TaxID=2823334 RepID=UPI0025C45923|nr:hypothetical protein [Candidatus Accumulibacter sp. ACC003]
MLHFRAMRMPLLIAAAVAAIASQAIAGNFALRGGAAVGPWFSPYGSAFAPPFAYYGAFGPCFGPCADDEQIRRFLDRYERNYGQRLLPEKPLFEYPPLPRDVPPTPAAHIQPRYRGASQIRPEFEHSGKDLGEDSASGR